MARGKGTARVAKGSKTPQPQKKGPIAKNGPKSEPPARAGKKRPAEEEDLQMLMGKKAQQIKATSPKQAPNKGSPKTAMQRTPKGATPKVSPKGKTQQQTPKTMSPQKGGSEDDEDDEEEGSIDLDELDSDALEELGLGDDDDDDVEEEDDDEDEDDDGDMDATIKAKLLALRKEGPGDDEDDDDDDDDEEGEEEDDEEMNSDEETPKLVKPSPTKKQASPSAKKPEKKPEQKPQQTQKAQKAGDQVKAVATTMAKPAGNAKTAPSEDKKSKDELDRRTLFIKNLPKNVTEEQIQELSGDIQVIRLRLSYRKNAEIKPFAYLEFKNEAACEKNHKLLIGKKVGGKKVFVDYCGSKSSFQKEGQSKPEKEKAIDPCKLYISGFGFETDEIDLKKVFPSSVRVEVPRRRKDGRLMGFAFAFFRNEKDAKDAHDKNQKKQLKGMQLVVQYARKSEAAKRKQPVQSKGEPVAKKARAEVVEEDDDDEDDEDDDDDEEEDMEEDEDDD